MSTHPTPAQLAEHAISLLPNGIAMVGQDSVVNVRWANSTVTTNGMSESQQLTVVAFEEADAGVAQGSASGVAQTLDDVARIVAKARSAAGQSGAVTEAMRLPEAAVSADWASAGERTDATALQPVAGPLGEVMRAGQAEAVEHFGYAEHTIETIWLATSTGTRLRHVQPTARFELSGKSDGRTRSAWHGWAGRDFADLDVAAADADVRRGLGWQARRIDVAPGRHRAVLSPSAVADLMACFLWGAAAREAHEGRGAFAVPGGGTRIGQTLSPLPLSVRSDPDDAAVPCIPFSAHAALTSLGSPFDAGLAVAAQEWVADGELRRLATTRFTAAEAGLEHAELGDNMIVSVDGRTGSLEDLVARTEDGLLLNCLWYIRDVDPASMLVTGLTRDGVYVVRGGEVIGAAGNFRFNESPLGMLNRIEDAGASTRCLPREWADWFTRAACAPLTVEGFNFSTRSDAL